MKPFYLYYIAFILMSLDLSAQFEPNYDETRVPQFQVPDPLTTFKGKKIKNVRRWKKKRRPELLAFFAENMYGKVPGTLDNVSFKIIEEAHDALGGKSIRKQIEIRLKKKGRILNFTMLLYMPKSTDKVPLFLGYNFYGNHTVTLDPMVIVSKAWSVNNEDFGVTENRPVSTSRGVRAYRWSIGKIIDAGYGLATLYYGEVDPDKNDFSDGLHPLFYTDGQLGPKANEWGSLAAWALGLRKALDYLETDSHVDASKVMVFGHSRLGKTALWAGALDQRFAGVISNNSGCGGAALSKRRFGETLGRINANFPHWFCDNFKRFNEKEEELPADQHQLLALIAPRPLYVASAQEDEWADPKGEFLSAYHASKVYGLYGKKGIPTDKMPSVNKPIHGTVAYHIRTGEHDVTDYDWEQYIKWAEKYIK
ncbi:MAG: acetylxylan esterase [Bacteroidota bacterium]